MWIVAPQNYLGLFRNIGPWGPIKAMESMESSPQEKASGICIFKSPLFCQVQYSCTYHTMGWLRLFSDVLEPSMIFFLSILDHLLDDDDFYPHPRTCLLISEREEGREGERERNVNARENIDQLFLTRPRFEPTTQACTLTRNQTCNLSVYGLMLQPTEPQWPGPT